MKRFIFKICLCAFSALFFACSDSVPQLSSIDSVVIFDFSDSKSIPEMRLSVFAEATNEIQRAESIKAVHESSDLMWVCNSPRKISGANNKTWAGYTNFVPAYGSALPVGQYTLYYTDAAANECIGNFTVSYQADFFTSTAEDFPHIIKDSFSEILALYDTEGNLCYYDSPKQNWEDEKALKADYPNALASRLCYVTNSGSVVCMMPIKYLNED